MGSSWFPQLLLKCFDTTIFPKQKMGEDHAKEKKVVWGKHDNQSISGQSQKKGYIVEFHVCVIYLMLDIAWIIDMNTKNVDKIGLEGSWRSKARNKVCIFYSHKWCHVKVCFGLILRWDYPFHTRWINIDIMWRMSRMTQYN